ncbi:MAG TPA: cysteine desulfurase family protein [Candidatus Binataceae bacterium]|nr:cysteine desulfurase family protein [Candidatus Binataceae bacterium]
MHRAYFDHNATTPVDPDVLTAMLPYFSAEYGNPNSVHSFGQSARGAVERARASVAALIGARPSEIVFTSGGTEADNLAIFGVAANSPEPAGGRARHIVTTTIEHHAVLNSCHALERRGVAVTRVPVGRDGVVDPDDIRRALRPETVLVTVMHANNELGTLQPIEAIGRVALDAGVRLHTDAVQSAGKVALDVGQMGVDLMSLSAHKFYGPKGVGALFVRKGVQLEPLLYGSRGEGGRRAGTENVSGIVGLGKAAEVALECLNEQSARVTVLRDRLEQGLLARISGARVNGGAAKRLPNTCNITCPDVESESLVIALDLRGVACSAGAACLSGAVDPSHVLAAIGLSPAEARGSIRLSLGRSTTDRDVALALDAIPEAVARQRDLSARRETVTRA